jgi:type II secretory pathway pseudopilin PulG
VKTQRGYLLISVIVTLFILSAITLMMTEESVMESRMIHNETENIQLRYLAEAGMQHAEWNLQQQGCGPFSDMTTQSLNGGSYSATITPNNAGGTITTYKIPVSDDAFIDKNNSSQNNGNAAQLEEYWALFPSADKRALYRFDVASAGIPADATISSAVFKIFVIDPHNSATVGAYQVTADWNEASVNWDNINSSYDSTEVASIPTNTPVGEYYGLNMTALAQGWVNGSIANQGIMLKIGFSFSSDLAQYSSKEYANIDQRPYLEIKVSSGLSTEADIVASSSLAGVTREISRKKIPLYQSTVNSLQLQPDAAAGKDGWVVSDSTTNSYGVTGEMVLAGGAVKKYFLTQFDLSSIPFGSKILSSKLEIYLGYSLAHDTAATFSVHAMKQGWAEGAGDYYDNGDGVNWATSDGVNGWSFSTNHSSSAVDTDIINPAFDGWQSWDIRSLVQQWVAGERANYGVLIKGDDKVDGAGFFSSDYKTAQRRPKLTITYTCGCGIVCQAPQGSGKIAMVGNFVSASPDAIDLEKERLFESWGYSVDQFDDEDLASLNPSLYDLVYVSETSISTKINTQLTDYYTGVVNEEAKLYDELELATSYATALGSTINVSDNSHYITALFPQGDLPIYSADMQIITVAGTLAPDLQSLADKGGAGSLVVLDQTGVTTSGGSAAGLRINLPIGGISAGKFNWRYLNNNGRLLVQRALQWAVDYVPPTPPPKKIYWTDDNGEIIQRSNEDGTNIETVVKDQYKVRGLDIDTVNGKIYWSSDTDIRRANLDGTSIETIYTTSKLNFDIKLDVAAGKMYWSYDNYDIQLMRANLDGSNVEVLTSAMAQPTYLTLDIDNSQLYASVFANGDIMRINLDGSTLTTLINGTDNGIVGNAIDHKNGKVYWSGGASNDWIRRANLDGSNVETIITGLNAPQDIAVDEDNDRIYFTEALVTPSVKRANTDGTNLETIVSGLDRPRGILVVDASQVPVQQPFTCDGVYLDQFNSISYSNSDGDLSWSSDWVEINESDGPNKGDELITDDNGQYQLRLRDNDGGGEGVEREAKLTGASNAVLSLSYRRTSLDNQNDYVTLEISSNGSTGPWTELTRFAGPATDSDYQLYIADISAYISANTRIRLLTSGDMGGQDKVYFDDIQIQCSP